MIATVANGAVVIVPDEMACKDSVSYWETVNAGGAEAVQSCVEIAHNVHVVVGAEPVPLAPILPLHPETFDPFLRSCKA